MSREKPVYCHAKPHCVSCVYSKTHVSSSCLQVSFFSRITVFSTQKKNAKLSTEAIKHPAQEFRNYATYHSSKDDFVKKSLVKGAKIALCEYSTCARREEHTKSPCRIHAQMFSASHRTHWKFFLPLAFCGLRESVPLRSWLRLK